METMEFVEKSENEIMHQHKLWDGNGVFFQLMRLVMLDGGRWTESNKVYNERNIIRLLPKPYKMKYAGFLLFWSVISLDADDDVKAFQVGTLVTA